MDWFSEQDIQLPIFQTLVGILACSILWGLVVFIWQVVSQVRGWSRTFAYSPKFIRIAAVAIVGLFVSSQSAGAKALQHASVEKVDSGHSNKSSDSLLVGALVGSGTVNIATLSYMVAKRRAAMRSAKFLSQPDDEVMASELGATKDEVDRGGDVDWRIIVRVLGAPVVETSAGDTITIGKGKSLELLTWLVEHRESSTRSAARTALWSENIQDATFSNVVSELRRALNEFAGVPENEEWIPRTFTNQMVLNDKVVTDAFIIENFLKHYLDNPNEINRNRLEESLSYVRDLPFAGTNYSWADAEGITTSHVITTVQAAVLLGEYAISVNDTETLFYVTEKGLRVLPGHEELVALRMKGHSKVGNRSAIKLEWEAYARAVEADAWAGGAPSSQLEDLAKSLAQV
jgi:two-component SAPR family response regulator/flagellar biosynthesis protein FliQ